ncbi:hypothetical protein CASFOL_042695 [Castilleja foliolosa]|uniref:Uncharacterized protein n=1 Tax=Castilleja foliolosa TaxID=1961234 RepID=A0ABD3B833_9LAMI
MMLPQVMTKMLFFINGLFSVLSSSRQLGLCGPRLGILISRNPVLLCSSLDKSLRPWIEAIKEVLELNGSQNINSSDSVRDILFRILSRYYWVIGSNTRFRYNVAYLRNCGIVGSQLIMLLINERRLFQLGEVEIKGLVSRAIEMGFEMGSRMLVHGIMAIYGVSPETINKKITLLQTLGFTKDECKEMFVKAPVCLHLSEAKLKRAVAFYIDTVMLDKSVLVGTPILLGFSLEKRVIPRYKVLEMIKSKRLLKKASLFTAIFLTDKKFVENFILRFNEDDAKELQVAYEKFLLESNTC